MRRFILWPIRGYQWLISPLLPPRCRYLPSCSDYALEAVERHGVLRGLLLAICRLMRCHPIKFLGGGQGYDPVPVELSGGSWYAHCKKHINSSSCDERR